MSLRAELFYKKRNGAINIALLTELQSLLMREFHYRWKFNLESSPEQLWPLIADTNRFNRDTGVPPVETVSGKGKNARRRLRLSAFGIPVEWEEQPFEGVRPRGFGVLRRYTKGPIAEL